MPDTSFADNTIAEFLSEVAGASATPGGGSVAALAGALSASLIAMVGGLTLSKAGIEDDPTDMMANLKVEADAIARELTTAIDLDSQAYDGVMKSFKLPKSTPEEKKARSAAIQAATKAATETPLTVAHRCEQAARLALTALERGNSNAASDAAVGALLALTGLEGAALNVAINLGSLKDEAYVAEQRLALERLLSESTSLRAECWRLLGLRISALSGGENSL